MIQNGTHNRQAAVGLQSDKFQCNHDTSTSVRNRHLFKSISQAISPTTSMNDWNLDDDIIHGLTLGTNRIDGVNVDNHQHQRWQYQRGLTTRQYTIYARLELDVDIMNGLTLGTSRLDVVNVVTVSKQMTVWRRGLTTKQYCKSLFETCSNKYACLCVCVCVCMYVFECVFNDCISNIHTHTLTHTRK